ncbi:Ammonium transporter Amt [Nitrospira sp. KM1]|uniref:ammonium transporter n=1 Tax=Nitrospira sp. KM1 TaxID=1936990 RepID=UPI0013A74B24|nr:ammonium transporter [Nitrospira sp. KM1]BCA56797.1 Ammonium transporter Amt [Nitrospira sp. KM1]
MTPGDRTLWLLASTTLLVLVVPGVSLFYGGMVRRKNVMSTIALPFTALAMVSIEWMATAPPVDLSEDAGPLWSLFWGITASVALGLVAGGVVERVRFAFFVVFALCWIPAVFLPLAQSLWGGGWLNRFGCLDFAGGAVVHISAGVSALVFALTIGPRKGYGRIEMIPNHLPFSFCGAALMWVGWFGFTGFAAMASMEIVASAFLAIQLSAAAAALSWMSMEWLQRGKPTALGVMSGAVAGLVSIAPAAAYVGPLPAIVIGIGAGGLCYMVVNYVKLILGYDDSLDVFGMHGVGGTWGMIATGLFANVQVNPDGSDGLFYGYPYQLLAQAVAACAAWALAGGATWVLVRVLMLIMPARVSEEAEMTGLDLDQHGEKGYTG